MRNLVFACLMVFMGMGLYSCEESNNLGSMQFKFTGAKDTLVYQGRTLTLNINVFYLGGEREDVQLSVDGQGAGTNISFSNSTIEVGQTCLMNITSLALADTGYFPITLKGTTSTGGSFNRIFMLHVAEPINTPPKVILIGAPLFYSTLNDPYTDPGFTAGDEEDGDITAQVIVTGSVNVDSVGIYTISYVVTDSDGLKDSVTRNINIRNTLNYLAGNHNVVTTNLNTLVTRTWITTIAASVSVNNNILIYKISDCFLANATLTYDPVKDSLYLPTQTFTCITPIDTVPHTFTGRGIIIQGSIKRIILDYTDSHIDTSGNPVMLNLRDEYQLF